MHTDHETVMVTYAPTQRLDQLRARCLETRAHEVNELLGVGVTFDQRIENRAATAPHYVGGHARQPEIGTPIGLFCDVTHVMESTGVYWKPVWHLPEDDFDEALAKAKHVGNVPRRKADVNDAMWPDSQGCEHRRDEPNNLAPFIDVRLS